MTTDMEKILGLDFTKIEIRIVEDQPMYRVLDVRRQVRLTNSTVTTEKVHHIHKRLITTGVVDVRGNLVDKDCWFVTETGLYQLILHNNSPEARQIRDRIALEILGRS